MSNPRKPGTALQKWGSYGLDTAAEEQEALSREGGGAGFMKLVAGQNMVRILPPVAGLKSPFVVVYQHYVDLPDGQRYSFACPRLMAKPAKRCPVCEEVARLAKTGNGEDSKRSRDWTAKRRVFAAVIDRKNPDAGPQILGFGKQIHEALIELRRNEDVGGDYTHPTRGIDVIIKRTGSGKLDTRYEVNLARKSGPIVHDAGLMDEIYTQMPDLTRFARVPDYDEILARLQGEEPSRGAQRRGGGRSARAQDTAFADSVDAEFEEVDDSEDGNEDWGLDG